MTRTITELGPREVEFLASLSGSGQQLFSFDDAVSFWGDRQYTRNELSLLEKKGWLQRLERGSYMIVPLEAGLDRQWSEDSLAVGTFLAPDGAAAYWSAIRHWGWTTQFPRMVFFLTTKRRFNPRPLVLGVHYRFVAAKPERLFGFAEEWQGSLKVRVTDRERTVIDMMDRPDLSGGMPEVVEALRAGWQGLDLDRVTDYLKRFHSGTVPKRLGFVVEQLGMLPSDDKMLTRWRSMIGSGFTALERGGASTGPLYRRWNVIVNSTSAGEIDYSRSID